MALEAQEVVIRARLAGGNAVKAEAERVEASINKIGKAGEEVNAKNSASGLSGFFGRAGKSADTMAGKLDSMSKKSLQLGRQTAVLSAAAGGLIYESVKAYSGFNSSMMLLQTQAGATEAQRRQLEKGAVAFGKFGYSGTEVATALYPVQSVIKNTGKDLAIMRAAAMGAAVGHETLANAADALSSAVSAGTIGVHGYMEEMNLLHLAVGAGKMHLPTLVEMFNTRIFPTASSMGINQRALLGLLAGVSSTVGESGAVSYASVFRTLLSKLTGFKGQALAAAKRLGLGDTTLEDMSREGPMGLVKVLRTLSEKKGAYGQDVWNQAVNEMFGGSRSASTILTAVKVLPQIEQATGLLAREHGTAAFQRAFGQVQQTPSQQFRVAKAELVNTAIELGKILTPAVLRVLKDLVGILKFLGEGFKALPGPLKDAVVGFVAFSALLAPGAFLFAGLTGFGSLLFKVGGFLGGLGGGATAAEAATVGFGGRLAGLAAAGGPLVLFGAALAALTLEMGKHPFNAWEEAFHSVFGGHTAYENEQKKREADERTKFLHHHTADVEHQRHLWGGAHRHPWAEQIKNPALRHSVELLERKEPGRVAAGLPPIQLKAEIHTDMHVDGHRLAHTIAKPVTLEVNRVNRNHENRR